VVAVSFHGCSSKITCLCDLNERGDELTLSLQILDHQLILAAVNLTSSDNYKEVRNLPAYGNKAVNSAICLV
jgi:hypothetical protein